MYNVELTIANDEIFLKLRALPIQQTTSPFSWKISINSFIALGVHSANNETCNGISSTFSI